MTDKQGLKLCAIHGKYSHMFIRCPGCNTPSCDCWKEIEKRDATIQELMEQVRTWMKVYKELENENSRNEEGKSSWKNEAGVWAERCKKLKAKASLAEEMAEYCSHETKCILSQWQQGEPTADGGYRTMYAGKWYQSKPIDEKPKCNCGLSNLWAKWKELGGKA